MDDEDRLAKLERAVFAAQDDWPTGHASLQQQLDELFNLYGDVKLELKRQSLIADAREQEVA